jgi:hypothetical protein
MFMQIAYESRGAGDPNEFSYPFSSEELRKRLGAFRFRQREAAPNA